MNSLGKYVLTKTQKIVLLVVVFALIAGGYYAGFYLPVQRRIEAADTAELAAIIERETAAYISDKGAALGVTCHAEVETELRSGVPYPCAVTLDVERDEALAACIAADLGISEEKQTWQPSRTR